MTVQDKVLSYLLNHTSLPTSGQKLAEHFHVSRNAIWKSIEKLREKGYSIESIPRKGYKLNQISKKLDAVQIEEYLNDSWNNLNIVTYDSVTSTNDLAKQQLVDYPNEDVFLVSKEQTQGRGRRGKSFYSSLDEGVYFTLAFKPKTFDMNEIPLYTVLAATALVETLESYVEDKVEIKWVNDIFYKRRKIVGILSEITSDLENREISGVVIGIGLNLSGTFDQAEKNVQNVAGSLFGQTLPNTFNQNKLLAEFLNTFSTYEQDFEKKRFLSVYRNHLLGVGKKVSYKIKNEVHTGMIRDIDQDAHLIIEQENGELQTLTGQEISFSSKQFINEEGNEDEN